VKFPTPFEAACWGVLNQRVGMLAARRMKGALVRALGAAVDLDDSTHHAFPDADAVARCDEPRLGAILGSERKAKSVAAVARAFAAVGDDFLRTAPDDEVKSWLGRIHGVGPFTEGFVLFRGLGRQGRPPESPGFLAAARSVYGQDLAPAAVASLGQRYGAWAGHWMLYVWASTFASMASA
jgi:DNA-3-methyladenine glycosylase II